jgi:hypothetical protein
MLSHTEVTITNDEEYQMALEKLVELAHLVEDKRRLFKLSKAQRLKVRDAYEAITLAIYKYKGWVGVDDEKNSLSG